jgi:hypothetical protein
MAQVGENEIKIFLDLLIKTEMNVTIMKLLRVRIPNQSLHLSLPSPALLSSDVPHRAPVPVPMAWITLNGWL